MGISPDTHDPTFPWQCAPLTLCACCKFYLISPQSGYMLYIYTQLTPAGGINCWMENILIYPPPIKYYSYCVLKKTQNFFELVAKSLQMKKFKGSYNGYTLFIIDYT